MKGVFLYIFRLLRLKRYQRKAYDINRDHESCIFLNPGRQEIKKLKHNQEKYLKIKQNIQVTLDNILKLKNLTKPHALGHRLTASRQGQEGTSLVDNLFSCPVVFHLPQKNVVLTTARHKSNALTTMAISLVRIYPT